MTKPTETQAQAGDGREASATPPADDPRGKPNGEYKSAADILACDDLRRKSVWVEEWGTHVLLQEWNGALRDRYEMEILGQESKKHARATIVAWSVISEDGERIFPDAKIADLTGKSGRALSFLADEIHKLNFLSNAEIEELEKNSSGAPGADSS